MENEATRHPVLEDDRKDVIVFKPLKGEDDSKLASFEGKDINFSGAKGDCKSTIRVPGNEQDKYMVDDVNWTMAVNQRELLLLNDEKPTMTGIKVGQEDGIRRLQMTAYVDNKELMLLGEEKPVIKLDKNISEMGFVGAVVCKNELMLLNEEKLPTMSVENIRPTENPNTPTNLDDPIPEEYMASEHSHPEAPEPVVAPMIEPGGIRNHVMAGEPEPVPIDQGVHISELGSSERRSSKSPELQTPGQDHLRKPLPKQPPRTFLDAVEVLTLADLKRTQRIGQVVVKREPVEVWEIPIKPEPLTEDDIVKMEILRGDHDVKIKQEATLSDEGVAHRLNALGPSALDIFPIDLPDNVKKSTVTRAWMADTFGGNRQKTCPEINKEKFPHGIDDFWYMTYDFNPNAPRIPGGPGLMFDTYDENSDMGQSFEPQRVIMCTRSPRWTYMGQYRSTASSPLTQEEWNAESAKFRNYWVKEISTKPWGSRIRACVGLRHDLGRKPTEEEKAEAARSEAYKNLPQDLIRQAFASGEEKIAVWCMQCIGYDKDFQRKLATMPEDYVSPNDKKSKTPKTAKRVSKGKQPAKQSAKAKLSADMKRKQPSQMKAEVTSDEEDIRLLEKTRDESEVDDLDDDVDGPAVTQNTDRRQSKRNIKAPILPDAYYVVPSPSPKRRRYVSPGDGSSVKGRRAR